MRYVVLLRGVNVGGNHRVPKAELKTVLEELGFRDVTVYINSGNAVFSSDDEPDASVVQQALEAHFGFPIPTLVLSGKKIQKIASMIPDDWTNDAPKPDKFGQKSDVLYLFEHVDAPDILDKMGYRPEVETMIYVEGAVLANITRRNQSKYSLLKVIGTPLYREMTIRNITTAKKLAELVDASGAS